MNFLFRIFLQCFQTKTPARSKTLFDSDNDSDDDASDNDTNRFNIREEFEGAEGRKVCQSLFNIYSDFGYVQS
jgi:hypothetical protein